MQKREQSLKSGQMPPPLWTLDSCNPCPLQTSRLGGQLFDLTRFRLNGLMACQCLCLLQTDSSITPKLTSQQASRGVSLCVSQVWMNSCHKTLTAVVPETYMHTEAHSWRHVHRGFVCLCVSVEACNPQNIKTRLTLVVPRKAVQKENCVCLCQEVLWCWTMVPLHLVMWCLCACMCVSVCARGILYATVWKCVWCVVYVCGVGWGGVVLAVQLSHMKIVLMSKYCSQLARVVKPLHTHTHTLETGINNDSVQDLNQASWSRFILLTWQRLQLSWSFLHTEKLNVQQVSDHLKV